MDALLNRIWINAKIHIWDDKWTKTLTYIQTDGLINNNTQRYLYNCVALTACQGDSRITRQHIFSETKITRAKVSKINNRGRAPSFKTWENEVNGRKFICALWKCSEKEFLSGHASSRHPASCVEKGNFSWKFCAVGILYSSALFSMKCIWKDMLWMKILTPFSPSPMWYFI